MGKCSLAAFPLFALGVLVACGVEVSSMTPSSGSGGTTASSSSSSANDSSASGMSFTGGGDPGLQGCADQYLVLSVNEEELNYAGVVGLLVAPEPALHFCFFPPNEGGLPVCVAQLTVLPSDLVVGEKVAAVAHTDTDPPWTSVQDSVYVTLSELDDIMVGTIEGAMTDGMATYQLDGNFSGCPTATE